MKEKNKVLKHVVCYRADDRELENIRQLVKKINVRNRSAAVRTAVRELLKKNDIIQ